MNREVIGTVIEVRPKALYRVRLKDGNVITGMLSTKMRHAASRLLVGDQVLLKISQNDPHRGQIIRIAN
jgi:translation initiation factor IF-1